MEEGELVIRVRAVSRKKRYDRIVQLIEESESMVSVIQSRADTVVFDKTGTLTNATPVVEEVLALDGRDEGAYISEEDRERVLSMPTQYSRLYMAIGNRMAAVIGISDPIRPESTGIIRALKESGIKHIVMMTGDSDLIPRMNMTAWTGIAFNAAILLGGIAGLLMPGTAALLHNTSTIGLCLNNMRNILPEAEEYVYQ